MVYVLIVVVVVAGGVCGRDEFLGGDLCLRCVGSFVAGGELSM